ncbi:hypothetical protein DQ384_17830 [Sphaerisporangium album]|uniref:Uncharacterized protein n=1 Tax=Sphaerisporangium album TaxID=509200 RepID=A0A367FI14_9ACTN|nr:hypothetical protein [Sphaerisporangium album]RCG30018.1 hypothetical protein DQ384_17830 [Sphaerisporangium album]
MSGPRKHRGPAEPPEAEPTDPYGFGPGARISVGGYFPRLSLVDGLWSEGPRGPITPLARGPIYAVAFVGASGIQHAVPWKTAIPFVAAAAACAAQATVTAISGVPVMWTPTDHLACEDCAVAIAEQASQEEQP